MNIIRPLLALGLTLCLSGSASASRSMAEAMDEAAQRIVEAMKSAEKESLELGTFAPSRQAPAKGGAGLKVEIIRALNAKKAGLVKEKAAAVVLTATFRVVNDPLDEDKLSIREKVTFELLDQNDDPVGGRVVVYYNRIQDIAKTEGVQGKLDLDAGVKDQHADVKEKIENPPKPHLDDTRIKTSEESDYALEIVAKSLADADDSSIEAAAVRPSLEDNLAKVGIGVGQVYEVVVHNDSDQEIAVSLTIDGIDMFTFSDDRNPKTGKPRFSHMLVPARGSLNIRGWHKTVSQKRDDNFNRFLVTEYGKGAASKLPQLSAGKRGVITVAISKAHQPGSGTSRSSAETGFGPPTKVNQTVVKRKIDPPHEFITIRYGDDLPAE